MAAAKSKFLMVDSATGWSISVRDDDTVEVRIEAVLSREDIQRLSSSLTHATYHMPLPKLPNGMPAREW